jgi:DNA-binding NarL/FixJ family response regulator
MEHVRILVVDDHDDFRSGLEALLGATEWAEVAGTTTDGRHAVPVALDLQPDVVLMDLNMPDVNGIDATQRIVASSPHIKVLVLTMLEDDESVFAAIRAGARGYLLKGARRADILRSIEAVAAGEVIFGPGIADRVTAYFSQVAAAAQTAAQSAVFPELTAREREVLRLIAAGLENSEIAAQLRLSTKTVRNHASNIFMKLQVAHRAQAIVKARDAGLR